MPAFPRPDSVSAQRHETQGMAALLPRDSAQDAFQKVVIEAWTLLATALAITALRIGFRISALGIRNLGWDDYLVCIGAVRRPLILHSQKCRIFRLEILGSHGH